MAESRRMHRKAEEDAASDANGDDDNTARRRRGPVRRHRVLTGATTKVGAVLRLYDTRSRRIEDIVPATVGSLTMYCCGPTVYRDAHVGNLRTFLLGDLIRRIAQAPG